MTTKVRVLGLVMAMTASAALAADLNVAAESGGSNSVEVAPGAEVEYQVLGVLSDTVNEGLALFGLDLVFTGGDLGQADSPAAGTMFSFVIPEGITNPAGYGGTTNVAGREGDLVQVGGGANTIMNGQVPCDCPEDCPGTACVGGFCEPVATFPTGTVITGVAHPAACTIDANCPGIGSLCRDGNCWEVLVTGSLTAPMAAGSYTLSIPPDSVFANVISEGETGNPFWATEAAGVGTITNLNIDVAGGLVALDSSDPACDVSLTRTQNNCMRLTFDGAIPDPVLAGEVEVRELLAAGGFGADLSASFTFTVEGGNVLKVAENGDILSNETWYGVLNTGGWSGVAPFEVDYRVIYGDVDNNGTTTGLDASDIWGNRGPASDCSLYDIDGNGDITGLDASDAWGYRNSADPGKPDGHACSP